MNQLKSRTEQKPEDYYIPKEAIDEYRSWPIERRLKWLYMGNLLRLKCDKNRRDSG